MRSKASFRGHPIHPMLIVFPSAFLPGALVFDLSGILFDRPHWMTTGAYLAIAGIVTALVAAVPGLVDYFGTVPPNSSAKERATKHLIVNIAAVVVFAAAVWVRGGVAPADLLTIALEGIGVGLVAAGGWMGGTLVTRNQISVDTRYARAGRWKEERVAAKKGEPVEVAAANELQPNQMKLLHIDGKRIVLARTEDGYVAFADGCTHRGGSLAGGTLACGTVQCLWHGSQFDVRTGKVTAGPAEDGIETYTVETRDGKVRLTI